jgi:hypothetical protein
MENTPLNKSFRNKKNELFVFFFLKNNLCQNILLQDLIKFITVIYELLFLFLTFTYLFSIFLKLEVTNCLKLIKIWVFIILLLNQRNFIIILSEINLKIFLNNIQVIYFYLTFIFYRRFYYFFIFFLYF